MTRTHQFRVGTIFVVCLGLFAGQTDRCRADGAWSGMAAVTTDYVFRGVSQTYEEPALQAGINYQNPSGWFVGSWASNVNPYPFGSDAAEINLYAGLGWALTPKWSVRASYTRYLYLWDSRPKPYDYGEFAATLGFEDRLAATISYRPDSTAYSTMGYVRGKPSAAYEVTGRWPLPHRFALGAGVGYYDLTHLYGVGYWSGSVGFSYSFDRLEIDIARFFCDGTVRRLYEDASADGEWVATLVYRF